MKNPVLYYFDGQGRGEVIRWMLAACGLDFEEVLLTSREQYLKMVADGLFLYQQVPMLEIDDMRLVQCGAILRYLARKGNLYGDDAKEQAMIDMYTDGAQDMFNSSLGIPFQSTENAKDYMWKKVKEKIFGRYFPVFEKALQNRKNSCLVGARQSMADVLLTAALTSFQARQHDILDGYPNLQKWFDEQKKIEWISKFLAPGSKRKPLPDDKYVDTVNTVLNFQLGL
ncbi:glutathione S-transferase 3-like [Clavelina lepadiformis]|uniref:glutathione S-transferase 3-like n=1 Tax=Clavelina lepadiformis TaxID=159417 RepID=UPI0040437420